MSGSGVYRKEGGTLGGTHNMLLQAANIVKAGLAVVL